MDGNIIMIGAIVLIVVAYFVIRYVVNAGANKAEDAIKNAWAKKKAQEGSPQEVSLADRYGQSSNAANNAICPQCGNVLPAGTKFCNKCGASLDNNM